VITSEFFLSLSEGGGAFEGSADGVLGNGCGILVFPHATG
jgi:hypothetical protein